ncbi:MAG TPA: polysaccharide biosynthesis/export family protein [Allosphingosinicella sp.]|nr:polysaccharide biosynthesis/export family protein [Allosphingosinicella sp.]
MSARLLFVALILAAAMLLTGCVGSRGGPIPYEPQGFQAPDAPQPLRLEDDYKIAPLDTLKISIFQVPDLSGEYEVDLTGHIAMPLLGNVDAANMTTAELDTALTRRLGEKYLQSPDVSVGITKSTSRVVTVDGSVRQPGQFQIAGQTTLMQVVAMARGTDENSNPRRIAIFRTIQGQRMAAAFDLISIRRGQMEDPKIYPGDIVVVDGSKIKALQREILQTLPLISIFRPF